MKKLAYLICLSLFFTSCCYSPLPREYLSKEFVDNMQINATINIVKEHQKYAKEKYGMELYEEPTVLIRKKVTYVEFAYDSKKKVEITEARKIHLDLLNTLLERFNSDPKYRDYMAIYPFTEKNVGLQLNYYDDRGMAYEEPYIKVTSSKWKKDCIQYFQKGDRPPSNPFYEDSIEEAENLSGKSN